MRLCYLPGQQRHFREVGKELNIRVTASAHYYFTGLVMPLFSLFAKATPGLAALSLLLAVPAQAKGTDDSSMTLITGASYGSRLPDTHVLQNINLLSSLLLAPEKHVDSIHGKVAGSDSNSLSGITALFASGHSPSGSDATSARNAAQSAISSSRTDKTNTSASLAEKSHKDSSKADSKNAADTGAAAGSAAQTAAHNYGADDSESHTSLAAQSSRKFNSDNNDPAYVTDPSKCPQGKRWRIAVNQSGPFIDFRKVFRGMVLALTEDGLVRKYAPLRNINFKLDDPGRFDALATATKGGCIEFVPGTFSNYNWDRKGVLSDKLRIKRMIDNGEIDMIWTFGTISGLYFADSGLGVPVLVIDSTSPEGAGIIGPGDYSNKPNVHVQKDLTRYSAEVVLFHNLLKFKRMGILVDSNEDNQSGQDIFEIRALAKTMGFELVPCYGDIMGRVPAQADVDFKRCLAMLSEENIDALFLTLVYRPEEPLFPYIKPFIDRGIPVYSQYGEQDVRGGALLSLSESDLTHAAIFQANVVRQIIIEGKKPEEISQHFHAPLSISFNMQTARLIEWQPSFEALLAIDNVYSHIEGADTSTGYNARMPEDEEARNSQHNMFDTSLSTNAAVLMQSKDSSSHGVKSASSQHP